MMMDFDDLSEINSNDLFEEISEDLGETNSYDCDGDGIEINEVVLN